jgi:hypothetical protein
MKRKKNNNKAKFKPVKFNLRIKFKRVRFRQVKFKLLKFKQAKFKQANQF